MKYIAKLFGITMTLAGAVLANGFFSTVIALIFPPWAWYLVVERLLFVNGLLW